MKLKLLMIFMMTVIVLTCICLICDIRLYRIVSPSMEPFIPVGSLVVVSHFELVGMGDIVAYRLDVMW